MFEPSETGVPEGFGEMGPLVVDKQIRDAIQLCWMLSPKERRSVDAVEKEISRLVARAFQELREDGRFYAH